MEMIIVNAENIEHEHICCAISSHKDIQVLSKKRWLKQNFQNGLRFVKMNVRGKCFIEYMPLEKAWTPIIGQDMMYINCLWVAGKYQGLGYGKTLLNKCIEDSLTQGKRGICILSAYKKKSYLMDYQFLYKHGFREVDTWKDYALMYYSLQEQTDAPKFAIQPIQDDGLHLYYYDQCPFHAKYVQQLQDYCQTNDIPLHTHHIQTFTDAKHSPTPFSYSLFYQKELITRDVLNIKRFEKIWRTIHE